MNFEGINVYANQTLVLDLSFGAASPPATPEPSSLILLGTGLLGMVDVARRRLNRAHQTS